MTNYEKAQTVVSPVMFPIEEREVGFKEENGKWEPAENRKAVIRPDTGELISILSNRYTLLPNQELFNWFTDACDEGKIEYEVKSAAYRGGKTVIETHLPNNTESLNGDEVHMRALLINSYDGSSGAVIDMGFYRLVCSNGAMIGVTKFREKRIHVGEVEHLGEKLHRFIMDSQEAVRTEINQLFNKEINPEKADEIFEKAKAWFGKKAAKAAKDLWVVEQVKNAWVLYNIFTYLITHHTRMWEGARIERLTLLAREADKW